MYYNKELFINEEIKVDYNHLNKKQTVLLLSILLSIALVALAVIITLGIKFSETFMTGYAMAILGTVMFAVMFSLVLIGLTIFATVRINNCVNAKKTAYSNPCAIFETISA